MASKRKIIVDCDPGIDDAFALALAAANLETFDVLGITTVSGNLPIEQTTENALRLSVFYGMKDIPVAVGAGVPLVRTPLTAVAVHGVNGLGNVDIPETDKAPVSGNAVTFMKELIDALPEGEKVTIVPTGPCTNIALLLRVFPEVKERIEEIVLMGGAAIGGNITMSGEFNIYEDPEAAAIVFDSGLPIVMCGLDVTGKCGLGREELAVLMNSEGSIAGALGKMLEFYFENESNYGHDIASIHDASTIMYLLHPEIYKGVRMPVTVDCSEGLNRGATICDTRVWTYENEPTTTVLMDADNEKFRVYLLEAILKLDK